MISERHLNILIVHEVDLLRKVVFDIHSIAAHLSMRGHSVFVIDCPDPNPKEFFKSLRTRTMQMSRAGQKAPVTLVRSPTVALPVLNRASAILSTSAIMRRTIREHNIDVLVVYSAPTNGIQAMRLARASDIPVAFRSIDNLHKLVRFPVLSGFTKVTEEMMYRNSDRILALTPGMMRYAITKGADPGRIQIIPNGVDPEVFTPRTKSSQMLTRFQLSSSDRIVVFVGSLFDFSGVERLVADFDAVKSRVPEAKLLIVGDGPSRQRIELLIKRKGLTKDVLLTGFRPFEEIPNLINLADVCILPFDLTPVTIDISPIKLVQYLACSKPVLSTNLPGVLDLFPPEESGVAYTQSTRFVTALGELLSDAARTRSLGENGRAFILENFTWSRVIDRLETTLASMVTPRY